MKLYVPVTNFNDGMREHNLQSTIKQQWPIKTTCKYLAIIMNITYNKMKDGDIITSGSYTNHCQSINLYKSFDRDHTMK